MSSKHLKLSGTIPYYLSFLLLLCKYAIHAQPEVAGLTLDELEMLEDFELKQLRDFARGRGSVSKAGDNEEINLFSLTPPQSSQSLQQTDMKPSVSKGNGTEFFIGSPMQIMPTMIQMPNQTPPIAAQASNSKKPKLKLRRKNSTSSADAPKKDTKKLTEHSVNSSPNGLREDDSKDEQSNRSDDLTGEDYEKLAKLLQTFVNRRKGQNDESKASGSTSNPTKPTSASLPPWAVTQKTTTAFSTRGANQKGLSKITEQDEQEEAMFSVNDQVQKPEPAHVWHERKTTTKVGPGHRFDLRKSSEQEADLESKLALIDNEVERDPRDWELKMRQLSRELSTILHRLKNEKEEKGLIPKTEFKVAVQSLGNIQRPKSATKNTPDTKSVFEVIDDDAGENDPNEDENHEETPKPDSTQRLTLGSLKINRKNLPNHQGSTNGKAYVTILREGIARQTDINEYVFIASITLVRDSNKVILVDTGLATDINGRTDLLTKLSKLDIAPPNVDYVITTHGHPDHAGNTNDFPDAIHFQGNMLHHRTKFNFSDLFEKDVHQLTPNVQLIKTPGHTPDDITVMVRNTDRELIGGSVAVCGDVFVAEEDQQFPLMWKPMAWSERTQEASRRRLICDADFIVPGHGKVFKVTDKMKSNFKC